MKIVFATLLAAATVGGAMSTSLQTVHASEGNCGYWAFAGAFQSRRSADRRARQVGGAVYDLDQSDSPNAGKGFWVVAYGPGPRNWANQRKRDFQRNGVRGAYVAARCIWG